MKFYNFTGNSQTAASISGSGLLSVDQGKLAGIEADMSALKKKVAKFSIKLQTVKEELAASKEDLSRDIDGVKMQL